MINNAPTRASLNTFKNGYEHETQTSQILKEHTRKTAFESVIILWEIHRTSIEYTP